MNVRGGEKERRSREQGGRKGVDGAGKEEGKLRRGGRKQEGKPPRPFLRSCRAALTQSCARLREGGEKGKAGEGGEVNAASGMWA